MNNDGFYILYNPTSGSGLSVKFLKKLKKHLDEIHISYIDPLECSSTSVVITPRVFKSEYTGYIKQFCQDVAKHQKMIIIGGDGTFHEAINGLMLNINLESLTVGFLPGGTGNSFMYDLNAETYSKALLKILNGKTKKIDILELDLNNKKEYAFNIVGWGLVSDINILSEKLRFLGSSRYTLASIYYIFRKKTRYAQLTIDGHARKDNYIFIMCLNTIHTGKGMKAAPRALLDDGLLDIILVDAKISIWNLIFLLPKIFTGKHIYSKYVEYIQAKKIKIKPKKNEMLNVDGENKLFTPVSISVIDQKIKIYY